LFHIRVNGAGNAYCSDECKYRGSAARGRVPAEFKACAWCGKRRRVPAEGLWDYVCNDCTEPIRQVIGRLRMHHVPLEMVRALLDNPACAGCGADIVTPQYRRRGSGNTTRVPTLVVDHDHECCPGPRSCGKCVRGLICNECNLALGLGQDPQTLRSLADYLDRWSG
jgi:hypothetical protein